MTEPIELWPFQTEAIDQLTEAAAAGARRLLLQAATGSGKTVIASRIIQHAVSNAKRVLFLAHRRELVGQCENKLARFGVSCGVMLAGDPWDPSHAVNVASIQTLHSWVVQRQKIAFPQADLVVIDEAHHYNSSKTWQDLLAGYSQALVLGMTATPINRRGCGLGHYFDAMICCPSIAALTKQGYLVPPKYFAPSTIDLSGLRVQAGDYIESELEDRMDVPTLIGDICTNWARYGEGRQTMVFASGVKHSIHLTESFNRLGINAAHVDGHTPKDERDGIVRAFDRGDVRVLCNCAVFTEGTDIPSASCLIFARPTKSLLLYLQVAGRVLRSFPGKKDAIILDHAGVVYEHGPIDQEWAWALDYGEGDVRSTTEKKTKLNKEITCGNCKAVYWGRLFCPECGWQPILPGREVRTYEAYLQALDDIAHPKLDKQTWYRMLLGYCRESGKKDGLAFYKFQDKFNEKPPWSWRELAPMEPSQEVEAWLTQQRKLYFWRQKNPELAARMDARKAMREA